MTTFIPGGGGSGNISTENLEIIELRVISNLLQTQAPAQQQEELRILRNDQAFELGIVPPVVPGN